MALKIKDKTAEDVEVIEDVLCAVKGM